MSPFGAHASEAGGPPPGPRPAVPAASPAAASQAAAQEPPAEDPAAAATAPGSGRNPVATAALACGVLGGALVTIPAGLVLGVLGLRRRRSTGRGALRCWLAIGLSLAWAGAAAYVLPNLIRATDPGCVAYKNSALTSYNRVVSDVNDGSGPQILARDLAVAIGQIDRAARDSHSATAVRSLRALSSGLRTVLKDVRAQVVVPRPVLLRLNRETGRADGACGTIHL